MTVVRDWRLARPLLRGRSPRPAHCSFDLIGKRHEMIMHAPVHVPLDRIRGKVAHQRCFCSFLPQFLDRCKVILHGEGCSISWKAGAQLAFSSPIIATRRAVQFQRSKACPVPCGWQLVSGGEAVVGTLKHRICWGLIPSRGIKTGPRPPLLPRGGRRGVFVSCVGVAKPRCPGSLNPNLPP